MWNICSAFVATCSLHIISVCLNEYVCVCVCAGLYQGDIEMWLTYTFTNNNFLQPSKLQT